MSTVNFKKCPRCGAVRETNDLFCGTCGNSFGSSADNYQTPPIGWLDQHPLTPTQPVINPKSHRMYIIVIAILVLMLIGAGFFELGQMQKGSPQGTTGNTHSNSNQSGTQSTIGNTPATMAPTITPTPTLSPTPTPIPQPQPGTVLYQEDGSDNWSGWLVGTDWTVLNGKLINTDGNGNPPLTVPYSPGGNNINDYAVVVKITRIKYTSNTQGSFGIVVRDDGNKGGYTFSICAEDNYAFGVNSGCNNHDFYEAMLLLGQNFPDGSVLKEQSFKPTAGIEYTYRVEVQGGTIQAFINGNQILGTETDYTYLSGGQISIWDMGSQLSISSVEVIAL